MDRSIRQWPARSRLHRWLTPGMGLLLALSGFAAPARAAQYQVIDRARFVGQVTFLDSAAAGPTSFELLQPSMAVVISINRQTQLTGKSAEANVEGLARDDYAVVNARRVGTRWVASKIVYDVDPILPLQTVTGSIVRVSVDGRRIYVRLDAGGSRWITIGRLARYRLDGRLLDPSPIPLKGEAVQLIVNRSALSWVALEVDLRSVL